MRRHTGFDKTRNHDFIQQNASRMLAWDTFRSAFLGDTYTPMEIAERTGMPIQNVYAIIDSIKNKMSHIRYGYTSSNHES